MNKRKIFKGIIFFLYGCGFLTLGIGLILEGSFKFAAISFAMTFGAFGIWRISQSKQKEKVE